MSDEQFEISNQLRIRASRMCCDGYYEFDAKLDVEAADEIVRLRAALAKITAGRYDGLEVTHYSAHDCRNIARAALIKTT
jgi:hypothetical protein